MLRNVGYHPTINLFVKSAGGNGQVSLRLVSLLRQQCDRLVALVPLGWASAATIVTLGADEIHMEPTALLTPVDRDNNRVNVSLDELHRVIRLWRQDNNEAQDNAYKSR